jgi:UDP-N-acetyl-D-mannosaminuronic acid transferase (WecB/TagA/CpsF family)
MKFCNINFNLKNKADLFERGTIQGTKVIITTNAAFIVEANNSKRFFEILNNNYVTFDGSIPYIIAKILTNLGFIRYNDD